MALVRALNSFIIPGRRMVAKGTVLDDSDPIVVARPSLFGEIVSTNAKPAAEQATAAPGETRATKRAAKSAAK